LGLRDVRKGVGTPRAAVLGAFAAFTRFLAGFATFLMAFLAFAGLWDLPADAPVRFPLLRDAMCQLPEYRPARRLEKW
jgi:hypothetical protein